MEPKYFRLADPIYHEFKVLVGFDLGTKSTINYGAEKCVFALTNMQIQYNYSIKSQWDNLTFYA